MKAAFGIVSLLVTLAIVALLVKTQLTAVKPAAPSTPTDAYPDQTPSTTGSPTQIQQKVRDDVNKSLQDAAAGRGEPTEK